MEEQFSRTELLLGENALKKLKNAKVIIFGIGGVGGYCVEALVRSGIGHIDLVDDDVVCLSNINRQLIATYETVGRSKVEIMAERIHSISPTCTVGTFRCFYLPENKENFDFSSYDYIIDAVDTVTAKLSLIEAAKDAGVPIISAMGAGNKLDPAAFRVADIYETRICPLAKVLRRECKKRGIKSLQVVYSEEMPQKPLQKGGDVIDTIIETENNAQNTPKNGEEKSLLRTSGKRSIPGSIALVPPVAGFIMAGEVVKDLIH